jgi:soluble lytic murein transglycosylase-like protein
VAALILALAAGAAPTGLAQSAGIERWAPLIEMASARFAVPSGWIRDVMRAESNGATTLNGRPIRSRAGAMGLMQLMPETWADMRAAYGFGTDPDDPADNISAGTAYLRLLYERYGYPGLFAAYNIGPARYGDYLAGRSRLPSETRAYLAAVTARSAGVPITPIAPTSQPMFVVRHDQSDPARTIDQRAQQPSIFAISEAAR